MERNTSQALVQAVVEVIVEVGAIGDVVRSYRKECGHLTRRIKLLAPLFEELRDSGTLVSIAAVPSFRALEAVFLRAKKVLEECRDGSQFWLVMNREKMSVQFRQLTADLSKALDLLSLEVLDVSDEVYEQVELVRVQVKRAKSRGEVPDEQLYAAIHSLLKHEAEKLPLPRTLLEDAAEKLRLQTETAWKQEWKALDYRKEMAGQGTTLKDNVDNMMQVLSKIHLKAIEDEKEPESVFSTWRAGKASCSTEPQFSVRMAGPLPPDDFKCPISLELMKDPVIVATGQTYERTCIQRWLHANNRTCPKTQQVLSHLVLTPNYVLRSLIAQWCEANGMEAPKRPGSGGGGKLGSSGAEGGVAYGDNALVESLLLKLHSEQAEVQCKAAGELRLLAKVSTENRMYLAERGAIPLLVGLLFTHDMKTQEHAVTALLNLSILDSNKRAIVDAGAIHPVVHVLKQGSMEARENAAATLFSLSAVDENKVIIGAAGAIPALVALLQEGTSRGKKDAATALFALCIYQGNKARAIRTGIVTPLMELLLDSRAGMVDEALAILAVLATHPDGRTAIGRACAIPVLLELIRNGSLRNKENGASVLLALCQCSSTYAATARHLGAAVPLNELLQTGTLRAKRKALELLQHLNEQESVYLGVH